MVFLWGRNCIHVISEALDGHGRRERERDCYTVVELKPSALLCSALTQSHNEKKLINEETKIPITDCSVFWYMSDMIQT